MSPSVMWCLGVLFGAIVLVVIEWLCSSEAERAAWPRMLRRFAVVGSLWVMITYGAAVMALSLYFAFNNPALTQTQVFLRAIRLGF